MSRRVFDPRPSAIEVDGLRLGRILHQYAREATSIAVRIAVNRVLRDQIRVPVPHLRREMRAQLDDLLVRGLLGMGWRQRARLPQS